MFPIGEIDRVSKMVTFFPAKVASGNLQPTSGDVSTVTTALSQEAREHWASVIRQLRVAPLPQPKIDSPSNEAGFFLTSAMIQQLHALRGLSRTQNLWTSIDFGSSNRKQLPILEKASHSPITLGPLSSIQQQEFLHHVDAEPQSDKVQIEVLDIRGCEMSSVLNRFTEKLISLVSNSTNIDREVESKPQKLASSAKAKLLSRKQVQPGNPTPVPVQNTERCQIFVLVGLTENLKSEPFHGQHTAASTSVLLYFLVSAMATLLLHQWKTSAQPSNIFNRLRLVIVGADDTLFNNLFCSLLGFFPHTFVSMATVVQHPALPMIKQHIPETTSTRETVASSFADMVIGFHIDTLANETIAVNSCRAPIVLLVVPSLTFASRVESKCANIYLPDGIPAAKFAFWFPSIRKIPLIGNELCLCLSKNSQSCNFSESPIVYVFVNSVDLKLFGPQLINDVSMLTSQSCSLASVLHAGVAQDGSDNWRTLSMDDVEFDFHTAYSLFSSKSPLLVFLTLPPVHSDGQTTDATRMRPTFAADGRKGPHVGGLLTGVTAPPANDHRDLIHISETLLAAFQCALQLLSSFWKEPASVLAVELRFVHELIWLPVQPCGILRKGFLELHMARLIHQSFQLLFLCEAVTMMTPSDAKKLMTLSPASSQASAFSLSPVGQYLCNSTSSVGFISARLLLYGSILKCRKDIVVKAAHAISLDRVLWSSGWKQVAEVIPPGSQSLDKERETLIDLSLREANCEHQLSEFIGLDLRVWEVDKASSRDNDIPPLLAAAASFPCLCDHIEGRTSLVASVLFPWNVSKGVISATQLTIISPRSSRQAIRSECAPTVCRGWIPNVPLWNSSENKLSGGPTSTDALTEGHAVIRDGEDAPLHKSSRAKQRLPSKAPMSFPSKDFCQITPDVWRMFGTPQLDTDFDLLAENQGAGFYLPMPPFPVPIDATGPLVSAKYLLRCFFVNACTMLATTGKTKPNKLPPPHLPNSVVESEVWCALSASTVSGVGKWVDSIVARSGLPISDSDSLESYMQKGPAVAELSFFQSIVHNSLPKNADETDKLKKLKKEQGFVGALPSSHERELIESTAKTIVGSKKGRLEAERKLKAKKDTFAFLETTHVFYPYYAYCIGKLTESSNDS